jgi:SpoVK/Ycf46/Vps4 family AAA+-type ATPase
LNILKSAVNKSKYLNGTSSCELSLYKLEENVFDKVYKDNNIIVLKDVSGLELESTADKQKYMHNLEDNIENNKCITLLISSNKNELNSLFSYNLDLRDKYFIFNLEEEKQDKSVLYNNILDNTNLSEELKIKLLDYITSTYDKSELDAETYENNLINYILLNNDVPTIKEEKSIEEIFESLNELVGLSKVKKTLYDLVDLMKLKEKSDGSLKIGAVNLHMIFLGNPGTGKTTIARLIANILYNLKYVKENKLVEVSVKDLVAEYVGQTAPKTMSVIEKAMNGVLFIDEAYALAVKEGNSYNAEAIATLIQAMENYRDKLVVIFAGYTKEMQDFLNSNSGITSRIGYTLEFDDYTTDELIAIFKTFTDKAGFIVTDDAISYLREIIEENRNMPNFGNARFVRNIYEKTIIRHASNVKDKKQKKILKTITKEDINTDNLILK